MFEKHCAVNQSLGTSSADVVQAQDFQNTGTQKTCVSCSLDRYQTEDRQDQMTDHGNRILRTPDIRAGWQIGQSPHFEFHSKNPNAAERDEKDRHGVSDEGE